MAILTRKQFVTDFIDMTKKVAAEHGMTYDEVLLAFAVAHGGVVRVVNGRRKKAKKLLDI